MSGDAPAAVPAWILDWSPVVLLHPSETYFPCSIEYLLQGASLWSENPREVIVPQLGVDSLMTAGRREDVFVQIAKSQLGGQSDLSAPIYVCIQQSDDGNYLDVTFVLLFAANGAQGLRVFHGPSEPRYAFVTQYAWHQGDLESMTLRFRTNDPEVPGELMWLRLEAHGDSSFVLPSLVTFSDSNAKRHPVVFCAFHSHALYNPGENEFEAQERYSRDMGVGYFGIDIGDVLPRLDTGVAWKPQALVPVGVTASGDAAPGMASWSAYPGRIGEAGARVTFGDSYDLDGSQATDHALINLLVSAAKSKLPTDSDGPGGLGTDGRRSRMQVPQQPSAPWTFQANVGANTTGDAPLADDGVIYFVGDDDQRLYRINEDGSRSSQKSLLEGVAGCRHTPTLSNDVLYFMQPGGNIGPHGVPGVLSKVGTDGSGFAVLGPSDDPYVTIATPAVSADRVYFVGSDWCLRETDLAGSTPATAVGGGDGFQSYNRPVVWENLLFFTSTAGRLMRYDIDAKTATDLGTCVSAPYAADDGFVYYLDDQSRPGRIAVDGSPETRTVYSSYVAQVPMSSSSFPVTAYNGTAYFVGTDWAFWSIAADGSDAATKVGAPNRDNTAWSTPSSTNGSLYWQGFQDSQLWRYDGER